LSNSREIRSLVGSVTRGSMLIGSYPRLSRI
jgi:hypothetical protein